MPRKNARPEQKKRRAKLEKAKAEARARRPFRMKPGQRFTAGQALATYAALMAVDEHEDIAAMADLHDSGESHADG